MEHKYKWIAQDADGSIWFFNTKPEPERAFSAFYSEGNSENKKVEAGKPNPNWRNSLIDLEKYQYSIIDGILLHGDIKKVRLTDTELLDAIMEHELRVDVNGNEVEVISGSIPGAVTINKKGNIRKAIKKWLRKNT